MKPKKEKRKPTRAELSKVRSRASALGKKAIRAKALSDEPTTSLRAYKSDIARINAICERHSLRSQQDALRFVLLRFAETEGG